MRKHSNPRADYIAIATQQFADSGFHGVSLAALAAQAEVSKQALLHFFGTKERLYGDVLDALADRLCAQIDATAQQDAAAHLRRYFLEMAMSLHADPTDARLVIRALLDIDESARHWPLKPYLDRLIEITKAAAADTDLSDDAALAWAYQIIGALQYLTVSSSTVTAIYGRETREALAVGMSEFIEDAVLRFCDE